MARSNILRRVKRQDSPCNTQDNPWMVNGQGLNPCKQVELLCTSGPAVPLGTISGSLSCPSGKSPQGCCCSVATYALLSACWVCQGNSLVDIEVDIQPSYIDFFRESGCPNPNSVSFSSTTQVQFKGVDISQWALSPPSNLSSHWNFLEAQANAVAMERQPRGLPTTSTVSTLIVSPSSAAVPTGSSPLPASSKPSSSPGTIAAAVLGALALVSLISVGAWFVWRWRRRRVNRPNKGAKVDLTEPDMEDLSRAPHVNSGTADPLQRAATFPFPYEGVVPHSHPNAQHSLDPSRTDEHTLPDSDRDTRTSRRHTAPVRSARSPMDQLDRDLARLQGVDVSSTSQVNEPHRGEGKGQVHHPYIQKTHRRRAASITTFTPSSNSGSASSRRARRKSGGEDVARGRYFHLAPSAQYLADVARFPEKVDPERPWNIRRDGGTL